MWRVQNKLSPLVIALHKRGIRGAKILQFAPAWCRYWGLHMSTQYNVTTCFLTRPGGIKHYNPKLICFMIAKKSEAGQ